MKLTARQDQYVKKKKNLSNNFLNIVKIKLQQKNQCMLSTRTFRAM